jgi:hypothetical protein
MKPQPLRFLSAFISLAVLAVSGSNPAVGQTVEDRVKAIRSRYNEIESAKLKGRKVEFKGESEPITASCTAYVEEGEVVKVHLSLGGDHFASDEYFYYSGGRLIFVYASDGSWRFTGETLANGESETIDEVVEHRVYLSDGAVIRHLQKSAGAKKADELAGLLAKMENRPGEDSERAAALVNRGERARSVKTAADLGQLLLSEP